MGGVRKSFLVILVVGCGPVVGAGEGESGSTGSTSDEGSSDEGMSGQAETGEPQPECPQTEAFRCTQAWDCSSGGCGGHAPFDENGCLRPRCSVDDDCSPGELCFSPLDYGECLTAMVTCQDDPATGECICEGPKTCDAAYCVPASAVEFDPGICEKQISQEACERVVRPNEQEGCYWVDAVPTTYEAESCSVAESVGVCVALSYYGDGCILPSPPYSTCDDDPDVLPMRWKIVDDQLLLIGESCGFDPHGWQVCWTAPETEPPECECICLP